MKKLSLRLQTTVMLVRLSWVAPGLFTMGTFKSMSDLMEIIIKVAAGKRPMMCKLATIICNEQHDLVTIWAGSGANASPHDRIVELCNEIDELKRQLSQSVKNEAPRT
mgnify:CR=1 FL=1